LIHQAHRLFFIKMAIKMEAVPILPEDFPILSVDCYFTQKGEVFSCRGLIHQAHHLFFIKMAIKMEAVPILPEDFPILSEDCYFTQKGETFS
jgi:hypothetical protein